MGLLCHEFSRRIRRWSGSKFANLNRGRLALWLAVASLISHPIAYATFYHWYGYRGNQEWLIYAIEAGVILFEFVLLWRVLKIHLVAALVVSLVINTTSQVVGIWILRTLQIV